MKIKDKIKRDRLKFRSQVSGKPLEKKKSKKTGELELFKKMADEMCGNKGYVVVFHITKEGIFTTKRIEKENLAPINFSHIKPKGMYPELRLDPDNIIIVSRAYHEWQHSLQIPQLEYIN